MANENHEELARSLKERGLTCSKLQKMINRQRADIEMFRKVGFNKLAETEKNVMNQVKSLKKKVCRRL